jgi:hypothetical protein
MRSAIRSIACFALAAACLSCASRDIVPRSPQPAPQIYVAVDESPDGFRDAALDVSKQRLRGLGITFERPDPAVRALTLALHLTYRNLTPSEFEAIWGMTTFLLATLYPSTCAHRTYTLSADVSDASGHSRAYEETDTTVAWLWLFNGPRCGETPSKGEIESMTRRLLDGVYDRMKRDGAFSGLELADRGQAPLVRVSANRGADIAEQVLRVDRPFDRWTMADDPNAVPDYRVDLYFDVRPGVFSIPKAYFAIMTLGVFGVCSSTPITLIATITGPHVAKTTSYVRSKSVRGHPAPNGSDCEGQDENSRPEVFAALLRQVFAQAVRDKVIPTSALAADTDRLAPWVRIVSNGADGIVRGETARSKPLPRYVFGSVTQYPIDYSLQLDFAFSGGARKPGVAGETAAVLSIIFLGKAAGGCEPTTMALTAALTDKMGTEVARYQITHSVRSTGERGLCRDDEITNPNAVTDLVRSLYAKMKADGTLALLKRPSS